MDSLNRDILRDVADFRRSIITGVFTLSDALIVGEAAGSVVVEF